jgi:hypothetical protein
MSGSATVVFFFSIVAIARAVAGCTAEVSAPPSNEGLDAPSTSTNPCADTTTAKGSFFDDFECPGWSRFDGPCDDPGVLSGVWTLDPSAPAWHTTSLESTLPNGPEDSARIEAGLVKTIEVANVDPSPLSLQKITHLRLRAGLAGTRWFGGYVLRAYLDDVQLRTVP